MNALLSGDTKQAAAALGLTREREKLDVLTITDRHGRVLCAPAMRARKVTTSLAMGSLGPSSAQGAGGCLVHRLPRKPAPGDAGTGGPGPLQIHQLRRSRARPETEETAGMMLKAAAPILDSAKNLLGIVYGGVLLNRNFEIVDRIKQTVFQSLQYKGKDIGTATIFQDDLRISTNVKNEDGTRALGTRVAEDVYEKVVQKGEPWIDRAWW